MSRDATIEMPWADGDHVFRLAWGELEKLQEACEAGPMVILGRIVDGSWRMGDISHTIRLGLIGGGMEPGKALKLIRGYVEDRPPLENVSYAQAILSAAVVGAPDEVITKKQAAADHRNSSTDSPPAS